MACSNNCGTACSGDCTGTSSGNCGGCGTSCSTSCSTVCSGQCKGGCGSNGCSSSCSGLCMDACTTGCTGCKGSCNTTCTGSCTASCANDCSGSCSGSCSSTCTATCANSCNNDCYGCSGSCSGGCYGSCDTTCTAECVDTCNVSCKTTCTATCADDCTGGCKGTCTGGCGSSCDNTCKTACVGTCNNNCTSVCSIGTTYGATTEVIQNYDYTGKVQTVTLKPGKYKLECWGAQGGGLQNDSSLDTAQGGLGGYSVGTLMLSSQTTIYIYVGGKGKSIGSGLAEGGFNGGGAAYGSGTNEPANGGGGATDIRINTDSLYSRVIVAGGGGGAGEDSGDRPGVGGGVTGGTSSGHSTPATQTSTGTGGVFGRGANTAYDGGAGGGGWYGGGTYGGSQTIPTSNDVGDTSGGCGGSGYVYTGPTASNYPSGCLLNSSYYLTNAQTIGGDQSFKSPTGTSETGHAGNGYCRITYYKSNTCIYSKVNSVIKPSVFVIKQNNKLYDNAPGIIDITYNGAMQHVVLPFGKYKLECWGAQGGYRSSSDYGGKGGYSVGTLTLTQATELYVYVGGAGNSSTTTLSNNSSIRSGGFNGGGHRYYYSGGGGATDIRIGRDSLYARIIVAGGGGSDGAPSRHGMYGGGLEGGSSSESYGSGGYGGTQTGNSWKSSSSNQSNAASSTSDAYAGFGFGGNGIYYSDGYGGAGGGGWYGGSGAYPDGSGDDDRGGGGGSGYVYTSETAANYPSGNFVNSSYYLTNAQTIAGNQAFSSPTGGTETGHTGNGYCRITRISNAKAYVKVNGVWKEV